MGSSMGGASMGSSMGGASMGSSFLMQPTLLQRLGDQMQMQSRKRKSNKNNPIENAYNLALREELDSEIARWWFSGGMCFTQARNPHYVRAFNFAASHDLSGYVPPGYNKLRTTLLQKEKVHERLLEPLKGTWKSKGVSIVCDGWSDAQRRPLINFIAINEGGPMFLKAINCQGEFKDKHYITHLIEEVILEVGPMNVVQVITDNAPVCKSAGLLIEARFPNVFWTPCVVHTLNLALRNICAARNTIRNEVTYAECSWIVDIIDGGWFLKSFICNHSMRLSIFNDHATMKMLSYAETRFASSIIMLQRLKDLKHGLQSMVVSTKWASYREDDVVKAAQERDLILNEVWWDKVEYILEFTKPIYDMLRLADTDEPCLHLMYEMWDSMIEKVKRIIFRHEGRGVDETSSFYDVVHKILVDRWEKSNTPLHCLTHSLNPRRNVNVEFAKFSALLEDFGTSDSLRDRALMKPNIWWVVHGSSTPLLQNLALKLLGQPSSSSCAEKNWSTYSFIHSLKRNALTPQRAEDLVFVHSNLQGKNKMWDVGGDAFDTMEGVGLLEFANLSFEEPELEAVLFSDGNDILYNGGEGEGNSNEDEVLEVD
ncbi:hypothetical protein ACHQM5_008439 [Ranunculus cassubicifolius]